MATPYDANNTGGTLPLPRIHIPTWFTINSVSQYNDALLDLDLLDSSELTVERTINDPAYWACGDKNGYNFIGTPPQTVDNGLIVGHIFDAIFLFIVNNNNQVVKYGIQINYTGWINYLRTYSPGTPMPMIIDGKYAKKEISREWWFDVLNDHYYIPPANYNDRQTVIVDPIWVKLKSEFETFDTVEDVYLFWEKMLSDEHCSESYIQNIITENCTSTTDLYTEELYPLSPYGEITNLAVNLDDSSTSDNEYDLFYILDGQTSFLSPSFGGYYKENGTIVSDYTGRWGCGFFDQTDTLFRYTISFITDGVGVTKSYFYNKNIINKSPLKIISPQKFLNYIINESSFSSIDINAYPSQNALLTAVDNSLPSEVPVTVIKNEEYFDDQSLLLAFGDRLQEEIIIGNTVPKLGSIIAYSDTSEQEFLPDTNSSHILYFKNAELKSFNFAVQNNTVIDRIEKLYRYAGLETNLTTELENINNDPNFKNMKIKEGTADVPENSQTLFLTEGSVVISA